MSKEKTNKETSEEKRISGGAYDGRGSKVIPDTDGVDATLPTCHQNISEASDAKYRLRCHACQSADRCSHRRRVATPRPADEPTSVTASHTVPSSATDNITRLCPAPAELSD